MQRWQKDLDNPTFYMPTVPPEAENDLRLAAEAHRRGLKSATAQQITERLAILRTRTQRRNETVQETEAAVQHLVKSLAPFPIDIIDQAFTEYLAQPGTAFFPRNSGEILKFAKPLLDRRHIRAYRLNVLADEALAIRQRNAQLDHVEEIPIAEIQAWPMHTREAALARGWITQDQFDQASSLDKPEA